MRGRAPNPDSQRYLDLVRRRAHARSPRASAGTGGAAAGLTPDEVTSVAATHLDPDRLTTLVVGDFAHIADELGSLNLGETHVVTV